MTSGSGIYDGWTIQQLRAECQARGLPTSGSAATLRLRLEADDAAQAGDTTDEGILEGEEEEQEREDEQLGPEYGIPIKDSTVGEYRPDPGDLVHPDQPHSARNPERNALINKIGPWEWDPERGPV